MPSYFKPWRRKVGVLTLVMACVFAAGWVRSLKFIEVLSLGKNDRNVYFLESKQSQITLARWREMTLLKIPLPVSGYYSYATTSNDDYANENKFRSKWEWMGFKLALLKNREREIEGWSLPYWSIVFPLTLLSAWLLLSKPRAKKPLTPD